MSKDVTFSSDLSADAPPGPSGASEDSRPALLTQVAWVLTDGARAPYSSVIALFVFSAYFTTVVVGDPVRGQILWSYVTAAAAFLLLVGAPILGPIADAGGRIRPWLAGFVSLGVPCIAALWFATPHMAPDGLLFIMIALVLAKVSVEFSSIFINALLPRVARRDQLGLLSGLGMTASNISNLAILGFFLVAWGWTNDPWLGLRLADGGPQRATGPLTAMWIGLFSLPLIIMAPDPKKATVPLRSAVAMGLGNLRRTVSTLSEHRNVTRFLIARMIFNEGFIIMMMFTGVFAAGVLRWTPTMLVVQGLINSVLAAIAGYLAGTLDRRFGSKPCTIVFIIGCLSANIVLASLTPKSVFFFLELSDQVTGGPFPRAADKIFSVVNASVAIFTASAFSTCRALMAKLTPRGMLAEFFGLYGLSGTATAFMGPVVIGILTSIFHSQRAGISVGIAFFVVGLVLLLRVSEPRIPVSKLVRQ